MFARVGRFVHLYISLRKFGASYIMVNYIYNGGLFPNPTFLLSQARFQAMTGTAGMPGAEF